MPRRSEIQSQPFRAVYSVFIIPEYASKPDLARRASLPRVHRRASRGSLIRLPPISSPIGRIIERVLPISRNCPF